MNVLLLLALAACGGPPAAAPRTLTLAAYTTPRELYGQAVLPAFTAWWRERAGEEVHVEASYQGSGAQARAVVGGLEADVVALSLDPDVQAIADAGLIDADWRDDPTGGMVSRSIVVLAVRPGNPKGIRDWSDLARPDVEVLTPDVRTSGGAMWNVAALWGAARRAGADPEARLASVLARVRVMDKGARESMLTFEKGVGDVAITYENEVIVSRAAGQAIDYVVPPSTLRIDNPIAVVDRYAAQHGNVELAEAFVTFARSPDAQRELGRFGLRPVAGPSELPAPADLFTIADLGGWASLRADVFGDGGPYERALRAARP